MTARISFILEKARGHRPRLQRQNTYFKANCIMRGSFAGEVEVGITWPKVLLRTVTGSFIRKLLVTLKASARNSTLWLSRIFTVRESARSNCHAPGPTTA